LIGRDNPFGAHMSAIVVKFSRGPDQVGLLGLLGPMRMDYSKNLNLLRQAHEILNADPDYER